uniref:Uncharacterized protein n=1 Tax=Candidatus Methanogaster sp. ANME-2c ERB4 TaxID=2759911 RepID=A0A7G9YJ64_9EURY|nr:hypothetical protein IDMEPGOH_00004 [Methanosarcinales archaeon ANME-2c ERB4]
MTSRELIVIGVGFASFQLYLGLRRLSSRKRLFNLFWSVEKHDANPANGGTIGLAKSALICG